MSETMLGPIRCPECGEAYDTRETKLRDTDVEIFGRSHAFDATISSLNRIPNDPKRLVFPCGHSVLTVNV